MSVIDGDAVVSQKRREAMERRTESGVRICRRIRRSVDGSMKRAQLENDVIS